MANRKDLNLLQLELIKEGLVDEDEVLQLIQAKRDQARKTRAEIKTIMDQRRCSRSEAYEILKEKRRKEMRRNS